MDVKTSRRHLKRKEGSLCPTHCGLYVCLNVRTHADVWAQSSYIISVRGENSTLERQKPDLALDNNTPLSCV